ncbi:hypothetical protein C882_0962 [Caenispirillum salinarum AK4]|uniref:Uncharacterized protein n=1 Tax=Caenispirillum salinarum AK4 TaxID=1238182 RepID=K9HCX1_9PROT|nr:hypothetical protein C882_0962 [Caenispirillum salinarum AK4]
MWKIRFGGHLKGRVRPRQPEKMAGPAPPRPVVKRCGLW